MRHVISVLLQNEVGALTRMTGLFSSRGYNIESLNVAPTDDPTIRSGRMFCSSSTWVIPTWMAPRVAPPERTNAVVMSNPNRKIYA